MVTIGFVILSHSRPDSLLRLVRKIEHMYHSPAIVCHHDFDQTPLAMELFPSSLMFVRPHLNTRWGHISIVWALVRDFGALPD